MKSSFFQTLLDPEIALPMAGALMGNQGNSANFGNALMLAGQGIGQRRKRNKSMALLERDAPQYAEWVDAGVLEPAEAYKLYLADKDELTKAEQPRRSLNPIYGVDENGNPVMGTLGEDGSFQTVDTPGFNLTSGVDKVDLGTQWGLLNRRTGQIEGYMTKDLAGAEQQKEIGQQQGKQIASAPGDVQAAQNALDLISSIRNDPNRGAGTGGTSVFNRIPATPGYDFQTKVQQAKSGAFLQAIENLRGMGALSNAEGATATAAITRLDTATSEDEFLAALADYERIVQQGLERAKAKLPPGAQVPADAPAAGGQRRTTTGVTWGP